MKIRKIVLNTTAIVTLWVLCLQSVGAVQCYTRKNGDWDGDIWTTKFGGSIEPGLRPGKKDHAYIFNTSTEIVLSGNAQIMVLKLLGDKTKLTIKEGASLHMALFQGKGPKGTGKIEMLGGTLNSKGSYFILAGHMTGHDNGIGVFTQRGGVVTIDAASGLQLTRTEGTGIYQLYGGVLNIVGNGSDISPGEGTGRFEWQGGTLNTKSTAIGLTNNGGFLSPGGDNAVSSMVLRSKRPETYYQSGNAKTIINVESAKKYDELVWRDKSGGSTVHFGDGSTIEIRLLDGYTPRKGSMFDIVYADKIKIDGKLNITGTNGQSFRYEIVSGAQQKLRLIYE